jgi:hypothetical protein
LARQLLLLMCRLSALGFVATDLKPMNIVVSGDGIYSTQARLIDFDPRFMMRIERPTDAAAATVAMVSFLESHLDLTLVGGHPGASCVLDAMHRAVPSVRIDAAAWRRVDEGEQVRHNVLHYFKGVGWRDRPRALSARADGVQEVGPLRYRRGRAPDECLSREAQRAALKAWNDASAAAARASVSRAADVSPFSGSLASPALSSDLEVLSRTPDVAGSAPSSAPSG